MSLNLYPMVGALIGQSINSGYIIWSRWKQFERLSMCKPQTRLRSDGVSVVFVLSLQIHAIWLDFISTSSPRLLSSSSCALAGPYQFSQLSRTVSGRTPVSGLGSGNRLGWLAVWLAGASRGLCLFCFILHFYFIFFMISSATI